jgi:hypothetical protein
MYKPLDSAALELAGLLNYATVINMAGARPAWPLQQHNVSGAPAPGHQCRPGEMAIIALSMLSCSFALFVLLLG